MSTHSFSPNCGKKSREFVKVRQFAGIADELRFEALGHLKQLWDGEMLTRTGRGEVVAPQYRLYLKANRKTAGVAAGCFLMVFWFPIPNLVI